MLIDIITDFSILIILAFVGTMFFKLLNFPLPPLLGTLAIIGGLRAFNLDLPLAPGFFSPFVQIMFGIYIGGKITKDRYKDLKKIIFPALYIIIWSLIIAFGMGALFYHITGLDLYTSIISSSMGGLPEMTLIAIDIKADLSIMVLMHLVRMISTFIVFPYIFHHHFSDAIVKAADHFEMPLQNKEDNHDGLNINMYIFRLIVTLGTAVSGGFLLIYLGVPAGGLVGSMLSCLIISLMGFKIITPSQSIFGILLAGVGIIAANNITPESVDILFSGKLILPIILSISITFSTSFLVAFLIRRKTNWDFLTCLLASSPAGYTVMTALAIKYNRNVFNISMFRDREISGPRHAKIVT
jgi:uncharacterized protein